MRRAAMNTEFTLTQKRALAVVTVISLLFAAHFLRSYFVLIVVGRRRCVSVYTAFQLVRSSDW
jgi:hypothetical protein